MDNPYAYLREQAGYGHREFARDFKLNRKTLIAIETGQFTTLSTRMIDTLLGACANANVPTGTILEERFDSSSLSEAYAKFQHAQRAFYAEEIREATPEYRGPSDLSPFHYFVKDSTGSLQGFCKKLCVPQTTVSRYAAGLTRTMPLTIKNALKEVQHPDVEQLEKLQENWWAEQ